MSTEDYSHNPIIVGARPAGDHNLSYAMNGYRPLGRAPTLCLKIFLFFVTGIQEQDTNKALQGTSGHGGFSTFIIVAKSTDKSTLSAANSACPSAWTVPGRNADICGQGPASIMAGKESAIQHFHATLFFRVCKHSGKACRLNNIAEYNDFFQ